MLPLDKPPGYTYMLAPVKEEPPAGTGGQYKGAISEEYNCTY